MHLEFEKYGKILEGSPKNWYIFIHEDENTGGYLILLSVSLDPSDPQGFDDWVENLKTLQEYFQSKNWKIQWLEEN